jgi:predicted  nucleic acid-binding Zn-ribbon protein
MGPTNVALVKLFQADQALREAQARLDSTTRNVRIQERRLADLQERLTLAQSKLKEAQAKSASLELDIKSRDAQIEKLRAQQSTTHSAKEYQTFLVEINTQKADKTRIEEEALKSMEVTEKATAEAKELQTLVDAESAKAQQMRAEINDKTKSLQEEIDSLKAPREEAANAVPAKAREMFEKLADRYEGEAMAKLERPDRRREEYLCSACNMALVADVYNKLHSRDEMVYCTSCRRILYIPDELPVEAAVNKRKPQKSKGGGHGPQIGAYITRQSSAADVLKSVEIEPDEVAPDQETSAVTEASATLSEPQAEQKPAD